MGLKQLMLTIGICIVCSMLRKTIRQKIRARFLYELSIWGSGFQCVRKFIGGKWEHWCHVAGYSWMQVEEFTRITGKRPGGCFGTPREEDYSGPLA